MKHEYNVRLVTSSETMAIRSSAPDVLALQKAINSAPADLVVMDTVTFGPAVVNRQHIVIIVPRDLPST